MTTRRTYSLVLVGLLLLAVAVILCASLLAFFRGQRSGAAQAEFLAIKAGAERGDARAQANLGDQYFFGDGAAKNPEEAVKWWRKAAEQGDPKGQFSLAFCYFKGVGVEKDPAQGLKWYQSTTNITMTDQATMAMARRRLGTFVESRTAPGVPARPASPLDDQPR